MPVSIKRNLRMENSSPAEWNIIFVLKTGQKYDIRHARSIYNEVTNNVKRPL